MYEIKDDVFYVKGYESLQEGVLYKSLIAIQILHSDYDYILRTNMSSFYIFEKLLPIINSLPKIKCYAGVPLTYDNLKDTIGIINYVSGAGFIISNDIAKLISTHIKDYNVTKIYNNLIRWDDVCIGHFLSFFKIVITPLTRLDTEYYTGVLGPIGRDSNFLNISTINEIIEDVNKKNIYHIRTRNKGTIELDGEIYKQLTKYYYNI
jgi:hypothetical protein